MRKVYHTNEAWQPGEFPSVLAVGDSWCWYPNNNLLDALINNSGIKDDFARIQAIGYNGALLQQYVGAGKYASTVDFFLSPQNRGSFCAFIISGAGNDAVNYQLALKSDCSAVTIPEDCIDPVNIDHLLKIISSALNTLITEIRWAYKNDIPKIIKPIFINGYDYSVPDGRPFDVGGLPVLGPWLKPALDTAKVNASMDFRLRVMRHLLDLLVSNFQQFHDPQNGVILINSLGTLSTGGDYLNDWANELHPTRYGFNKIINSCWLPELRKWGMAT